MRHIPFLIHRIAMETASHLIINTAGRHFSQAVRHYIECTRIIAAFVITEQKLEITFMWKFGRLKKPSRTLVMLVFEEGK
jgi:hypothetical protein